MASTTAATDSADELSQASAPVVNIRLYLRAANLPKSITQQQPDTLARVSILPAAASGGDGGGGSAEEVVDETEIVKKSSNPKWTSAFSHRYELGSQMLFFVDILAVRNSSSGSGGGGGSGNIIRASSVGDTVVDSRGMKLLGRAVFDVQDVLGSTNNVKSRRLRKGGVVFAYVEQRSSNDDNSPRRSLSSAPPLDGLRLNLRLRASSLVHTHSVKSKLVAPTMIAKPDTYVEISRPSCPSSSSSVSWIVVHRSPPVRESVSPAWDEATIDLESVYSGSYCPDWRAPTSPYECTLPLTITVYKVKKRKCKEIGSCRTTVAKLADACKMLAKVTGSEGEDEERRSSDDKGDEAEEDGGNDRKTFRLRPTPKGGASPSGEITGLLSVMSASITSSMEATMRSSRFLTAAGEDEDGDAAADGRRSWSDDDGDDNGGDERSSAKNVDEVALPSHHPRPKFSDYVKAGVLDIDFCVAIDFTSSNGDPRRPGTQHFSRDGMMNDYEEAIEAVGSTIGKYSSSQEYPVWGFGAKYGGKVRHIFQIGGAPTAVGTQGILDAYRTVFETDLIMSGPTEINSVLRAAANRSKTHLRAPPSASNMKYCVLLILTDGIVHNLQSTRELVRKYGEFRLPLSVIVVGIGRADFSEFHRWNREPADVRGRFMFVEFRQHQFDPDTLSREALLNVPHEMVDYFLARNVLPR